MHRLAAREVIHAKHHLICCKVCFMRSLCAWCETYIMHGMTAGVFEKCSRSWDIHLQDIGKQWIKNSVILFETQIEFKLSFILGDWTTKEHIQEQNYTKLKVCQNEAGNTLDWCACADSKNNIACRNFPVCEQSTNACRHCNHLQMTDGYRVKCGYFLRCWGGMMGWNKAFNQRCLTLST